MAYKGLLSVVIPVYRSEKYLERTVRDFVEHLERQGPFEIVLVNDGSPDQVQRVIERLNREDPRVQYVELGSNQGQHRAILWGFQASRGEVVATADDDGQNPPDTVLKLVEALQSGDHDVVYGRFQTTEQTLFRRFGSRLNRWLSSVAIGNRDGLSITNLRALRGDLARVLCAFDSPYVYLDAAIFRATRRIAEVAVEHTPRAAAESTYRLRTLLGLWLSHMTTLTRFPLTLATLGCFGASGLGFVLGVVELTRVLLERKAPAGWLSLFCAITFLFSLLFAFLGVIGIYLGRMYLAINSRGTVFTRSSSAGMTGKARPEDRSALGSSVEPISSGARSRRAAEH